MMDILIILSALPVDPMTLVIIGVSGIIIGGLITATVLRKAMDRKRDMVLKEAMEKAEMIKRDKILQAKEKFLQLKSEHEKYVHDKNDEVQKNENRLKQKENVLNQKIEEIQKKQKETITIKQNLQTQMDLVNKRQLDLEKSHKV